jgi:P-type Ca2+ transporter type 2C
MVRLAQASEGATGTLKGLSPAEVAAARAVYGPNVVAAPRRLPAFVAWAVRIVTDPMAVLLVVAAVTYGALGDRSDAIVSAIALLPVVAVGIILEGRSDAALERLRELTAPQARVIREGREVEIRAEDVVPGDLLVVREGDVVAADGVLLEGRVAIDESALTGESMPVERMPGAEPEVSAGTTISGGRGVAAVSATGAATRYGAVQALLGSLKPPRTPIEVAIGALVRRIGAAVVVVCVAVVAIQHIHGLPWSVALIAGVSLAMAALPEELPMVYTLYLALGAWRLSRDRALVRRLGSVETLGSTSTICVDKTGTLTYGSVELAEVEPLGDARADDVIATAALASDAGGGDPLDAAIARALPYDPRTNADLIDEEPYDASRRYAARYWRVAGRPVSAFKGALESVLDVVGASSASATEARRINETLAARGMRVLAIARADGDAPRLLGLIAFSDPVREDVPAALAECRQASVRLVMVTGDHPATATAVARAVGFGEDADRVVTGEQLAATSEGDLPSLVDGARIFARTRPEQKLAIVRALRRAGQVVAMTGDGTNDALALRQADIGIAMGKRGTAVAREAAGLVLLEDDVSTIVRAIRDGRRIFENLRRAFGYLIGFHAPLLVAAVFLPVVGLPLLLQPIHLVWLELIVHPTSSLVFESDEAGPELMRRPPRPRSEGLLRRQDWMLPSALGLTLAAAVLAVDALALRTGLETNSARSAALVAMFIGQTVLIFVLRSPQRAFWRGSAPTRVTAWLAGASLASLALAITVAPLAALLHLGTPPLAFVLVAIGAGAISTLWWEPFKR